MSPEELFDPENLPEDLQWLAAEFRLQPNDPVFLVLAWHWVRVQGAEDAVRAATLELKAAVDRRIETLEQSVEAVAAVNDRLADVQALLKSQPLALGKQLATDLQAPVTASLERIKQMEQAVAQLRRDTETVMQRARRREAFAAFMIGMGVGGCLALLCI